MTTRRYPRHKHRLCDDPINVLGKVPCSLIDTKFWTLFNDKESGTAHPDAARAVVLALRQLANEYEEITGIPLE